MLIMQCNRQHYSLQSASDVTLPDLLATSTAEHLETRHCPGPHPRPVASFWVISSLSTNGIPPIDALIARISAPSNPVTAGSTHTSPIRDVIDPEPLTLRKWRSLSRSRPVNHDAQRPCDLTRTRTLVINMGRLRGTKASHSLRRWPKWREHAAIFFSLYRGLADTEYL
jgi:hypothetical protein